MKPDNRRAADKSGEGFVVFCIMTSLLFAALHAEGDRRALLVAVACVTLGFATKALFTRRRRVARH